jgi:succinoglycan biosynthesis protein ExoO
MLRGARLRLYPDLGYFYRKHAGSISHRLDTASIRALDAAYARLDAGPDRALARQMAKGAAARADALAFTKLIDALKRRDVAAALAAAVERPAALRLLKDPIGARLARPPRKRAASGPARVTLVSRQRIVGATNGSSAYVLALAGALRDAGYAVDYLGASPKIFGRWAVLKLRPEIGVFERYLVRGGLRLGNLVLAKDPRVWLASALAVTDRLLRKVGVSGLSQPAEYAQGAAPTRADELWLARQARPAHLVLCDYAFTAPLAPYALSPEARTAVIMHDLMSARVADAAETNTVRIAAHDEFRLLGMADAVIAIQQDEAAKVAAALPHRTVITAPHATTPVAAAQPGADDLLLFVGSNTAPNIVGLEWFFREVWPLVQVERPGVRLKIAGSVARAIAAAPDGVTMLGVVADLAPLYAEAGVVISPLYTGSGLKIKLVEALAAGKAVAGTTITAQGVEAEVAGAMAIEDDPVRFAEAIVALLDNRPRRAALAAAALACAQAHFSPGACFRDLTAFVRGESVTTARNSLRKELSQSQ